MKMHNRLISENSLLTASLIILITLCVIGLVINGLGIIASILMFISVCSTNQENLQRSRRLVIPWVVWCIANIVTSAVVIILFYLILPHEFNYYTPALAYAATFDCVFNIWAAVIGISYYQSLNEEHTAPSNQIVMDTLLQNP